MKFYPGIYQQSQIGYVDNRFFLSFQIIRRRKSKFKNIENKDWIMDSGAFSEIKKNGAFHFTPEEYIKHVEAWNPEHFVNMDWMCEPYQIEKTGKSVKDHQYLTTENQIKLMELSESIEPKLMGTIQGWEIADYLNHIDLIKERDCMLEYMGIGSVCRRHSKNDILQVIRTIKNSVPSWVKLHAFGVKTDIFNGSLGQRIVDCLYSSDSMAWSYAGRTQKNPGFNNKCPQTDNPCHCHAINCANCGVYMSWWLNRVETLISSQENQRTMYNYDSFY